MKPWEEQWEARSYMIAIEGSSIARFVMPLRDGGPSLEEDEARAKLASAAPDLVQVLEKIRAYAEDAVNEDVSHTDVVNALLDAIPEMDAALQKARGES